VSSERGSCGCWKDCAEQVAVRCSATAKINRPLPERFGTSHFGSLSEFGFRLSVFARQEVRMNFPSMDWRQWEPNPVVVKELRQAVRNWSVTGMLCLFLVVLFGAAVAFLIGQSFQIHGSLQMGRGLSFAFIAILTGASLIFIPLYVGVRLAWERQEHNLDLLYISTLTPGRIIRGKFLCGAYMTLLFFSACMPFMAFTILLRGVDLPTIFFILFCLFGVVCLAVQAAILLACLPTTKPFKILLGLAALWALVTVAFPLFFGLSQMITSGIGATMGTRDFWITFLAAAGIGLGLLGLLYMLSVGLISPVSANRALPLRTYVTVIWLLGGAASLFFLVRYRNVTPIYAWFIPTLVVMIASLAFVVSNHDQLSYRVRRAIPINRFKRALAFLFFNGAAGGLAWVLLLTGITYGTVSYLFDRSAVWFASHTWGGGHEVGQFMTTTAAIVCYAFAYALLALFIHRRFMSGRPPRVAGVMAILLPGAWAVVPNLILFFSNRLSWGTLSERQLGNPFNLLMNLDDLIRSQHLAFAFVFLLVTLLLNVPWFLQQVRNFKPLDRRAPTQRSVPLPPVATPPPVNVSDAQSF
jgi:hypothetical protein